MQILVTNLQTGSTIYNGDCEEFLYNYLNSDIESEFLLNQLCCGQSESIVIVTDETGYLIEKKYELIY